jgi:uncharacterized protein
MIVDLIALVSCFARSLARSIRQWLIPQLFPNLPKQANTLADINIDALKDNGICGIILDLDNTVVSEDDRYLSPRAEMWLHQAKQAGLRCFILSNGKRRHRVEFWSQRLSIPACSPAKKPFPRAFRRAIAAMHLHANDVVVIGDSRHTDMLGAWLTDCHFIQVASLPHPARWWEKLLGKRVQTPYPSCSELWQFETDLDVQASVPAYKQTADLHNG